MESKFNNQFVNSSFMTDHPKPTTTDTKPETITLKTISLNTIPFNSTDKLHDDKCQKISDKLGMDAQRLSKFYSLTLAFMASVAITCSIFLVKLSNVLSASDIGIVKFSIKLVFCLPIAYFYRQDLFGPKGSRLWLVLRGLTGALSIIAAYFSIRMIHFEDSMVIRYSSPIITAIFARIILKNKLNFMHFISFGMSLVGILCVIRPSLIFRQFGQPKETENSLSFILGIILSIVSAITAGSTFVFIKKLTNKNIHFIVLIFYFCLFGFLLSSGVSLTLYLTNITRHNLMYTKQVILRDVSIGLLAGLISFIGHVCFSLAIARETANKIAVLRTSDILIAFLLEYLVLNVTPHWITLIGAGLVLLGVILIYVHKFYLNKRKQNENESTTNKVENENNVFRI
ncbi:unnamed protein product [Brachionus calyciflorus]|uniref:EamA domain-containing protein n=1 Tax=Brachionus calyciflorus TaxID=104777 RepID=A0A813XBW5_9BILA|nr:unnamed protein product [Brachionus calyciflorus]